jgi:poly(ADP-ribose) glycohydrolase ARH3
MILESFHSAGDRWPELATAMFPQGSYGNGSAMRVAPIGLLFHNDLNRIIEVARISSVVTHSHWLAIQGATLQAAAVALAVKGEMDARSFVIALIPVLDHFAKLGQDSSVYRKALAQILVGISKNVLPARMSRFLGNGIKAQEAVPMAIYCFLSNRASFENALTSAIFLGGDTDTIASMTGAISGAALGESAIPKRWLDRITEPTDSVKRVRQLADSLYEKGGMCGFAR